MRSNSFQTLLVMVTGFLVLSYLFPGGEKYWRATALLIGVLGLMSAFARNGIVWMWEKLSHLLGWFNGRVLLSAVFILFLTPIALVYRLLKGDLLSVRRPREGSMYVKRDRRFTAKDLENPW